jgi:hypothetical protein
MKKALIVGLTVLLLCVGPLSVFAQGTSGDVSVKDAATTVHPISFTIDDKNVYDGMDKAYQNGYTPRVRDGIVTVVLPLITESAIKGDRITVTPELGDAGSSPFEFKNYQKTVSLSHNAVNNSSATVDSYLVRFDLSLNSARANGNYILTIALRAEGADGSPVQQAFTSYVVITDGKALDAAQPVEPPPVVEAPSSLPKVLVSGYSINPSPIIAGTEFTVRVTLRNTSEIKSVQNMTVTAVCDSTNISLRSESDTIFLDKLGSGKTTEITLAYKADLEIPAGHYSIALAMSYDTSQAETLASSGTIPLEIGQPLRVDMEMPHIAADVNAGDTFPVTVRVLNLGRSAVYNVRAELDAPGLIPLGVAFIGNMEAGTAQPRDMTVFVGTKDRTEGSESSEKYGYTSGTIKLIYEDATGQEYVEESSFGTTIHEPIAAQAEQEEPKRAGQWWVSLAIALAIAAGLAGFLIVRNRRSRASDEGI